MIFLVPLLALSWLLCCCFARSHTHTVLPNKGSPFLEVSMLAAAFWQIIRQTKMTKMCSVMTCKICRLVISPFGFDGEEAYSIVWLSFKIGRTWPCLIRDPFHAITEDEKNQLLMCTTFFLAFPILARWPIWCQPPRPTWIKTLATTVRSTVKTIVHIAIMETWNTSVRACPIHHLMSQL